MCNRNFFTLILCASILLSSMNMAFARPQYSTYYVAMNGSDAWLGQLPAPNAKRTEGPVETLARALELARTVKQNLTANYGGVRIFLRGGTYPQSKSVALSEADAAQGVPLLISAYNEETVRIIGGRDVVNWKPVTDEATLSRMDAACRENVVQTDLKAQGITEYGKIQPDVWGGLPSAENRPLEVFFRGKPMTLARWPNQGFAQITDAPKQTNGTFTYDAAKVGNRAERWAQSEDVWLHGYWMFDWADSYLPLKSADAAQHTLTVPPPQDNYGIAKSKRFYVVNALSELDAPSEWYLDRKAGILYFWPPAPITQQNVVTVSTLDQPLISLQNKSSVALIGLTLEATKGVAVEINGGSHNMVIGCTIRNVGLMAVRISGGAGNGVESCDIYETGQGGISLSAGDRKTLTSGECYANNNIIHDYSRWVRCYRPAVSINGVGNRVSHNHIYNGPHNAIQLSGNEHLIEYNDVHDVCRETGDVGAFYMGRDWTMRGNIVRYNYWHNLGGPKGEFGGEGFFDAMGVYLDDAASGTMVFGNVFYKAGRGVLLGGGRDNSIDNNLFVDCSPSVHVDARGIGWAKKYIEPGGEWQMEQKLTAVNYKNPPYSVKYPRLATIDADNPTYAVGNSVVNNISLGGKWLELQDNLNDKTVKIENNTVKAETPTVFDIPERGVPAALLMDYSDHHIPFLKMGLMVNPYRKRLPPAPGRPGGDTGPKSDGGLR